MKEYYVFWKEIESEVINKTFIVSESEESACNKVALIKGSDKIEILYTEDADRSQKYQVIDFLTKENVSISAFNDRGLIYNHTYTNSVLGREELITNEPEKIVEGVLAVWGDEPIIENPTYNDIPEQENSKNVWDEMAEAIKQGVNEV